MLLMALLALPGAALAAQGTPAVQGTPAAPPDTTFDQAGALAALQKAIAGKEESPAETVFKNIQMLKGMPAGRILRIMEMGYSASLGVRCNHCHVPGRWESDEKTEKLVAREMMKMTGEINDKYIKSIRGLKSEKPAVNCTTCHRGQTKPALNLGPAPGAPGKKG
jgi:hypothetical protein